MLDFKLMTLIKFSTSTQHIAVKAKPFINESYTLGVSYVRSIIRVGLTTYETDSLIEILGFG